MMNHLTKYTASILGLALMLLVAGIGCGSKAVIVNPAPPQSGSLWGGIGSGTVAFHRWNDELSVMVCTDAKGSTRTAESFSGPPAVRRSEGSVTGDDGRKLEWLLEEKEGQKIKCRLNDKDFDLKNGNLLLVKTKGGKMEIEQINQDLSAVKPEIESFKAFVRANPEVNKLIQLGDE